MSGIVSVGDKDNLEIFYLDINNNLLTKLVTGETSKGPETIAVSLATGETSKGPATVAVLLATGKTSKGSFYLDIIINQ